MSLNVVVVEVPTCTKLLQVAPVQRSIRYWLMVPPVSVAAVQDSLTCVLPAAVAVRFVGAVGVGAGALPTALNAAATAEQPLVTPPFGSVHPNAWRAAVGFSS